MMILALLGAGLLADCPPGCCEAGELAIARKMDCCETPSMTNRSPVSSEPVLTVRIAPHVLLLAFDALPSELELDAPVPAPSSGTDAPPRNDAPLFLLNVQFLI